MTLITEICLGYKIFTVKQGDVARCAQLFLTNGISVKFKGRTFKADSIKSRRIEKLLDGNIEYTKTELRSLGGFLYKNRKRYGVMVAIVISAVIFILSSNRVWDIRVEGCDHALAEKIKSELADCGFSVGSSWADTDLAQVEIEFLSESETASWLNINRRGCVAYVTVREKNLHEEDKKEGYSNIIATCDAVIEEISVIRGVAGVKVGDSVKKGDLLISGILPEELGGGFCYAEGDIKGRVSDSVSVSVPNKRVEKQAAKTEIARLDVNFFGFSVNILNSYRKTDSECDIIDTEKHISIFGRRLPISIRKSSSVRYFAKEIDVGEEEMTDIASLEMSKMLSERLADATLLKIRTDGIFLDDEYVMTSDFVCIEQIGRDLPFEVNSP